MLKSLRITNFKSWEKANLDCGMITGIFGTNSSGKTSLIQFLLLMKQTKDATDRAISLELNGGLVQLGTIKDAIHRHDENRSLEIGLVFKLPYELALKDPELKNNSIISKGNKLDFSAVVTVSQQAPSTHSVSYKVGDMKFELSKTKDQFDLKAYPLNGSTENFKFFRTKGRIWPLPGPVKTYAFPDQARTYFQNAGFLADIEREYESALDRMFYIGPLREYPKRDYLWARSRPTDVGQRGEKVIDAILAATEANVTRNIKPKARLMSFQAMIAHWLQEMGLIHSFKVEEIAQGSNRWQAKVKTRAGASEVLLTDVGFGISQVLPVITLLQYVPEGSTVIFEQPEIHLHPLAQAGLADVIIQAAMHRNVQVILESHSEHLLLRLQKRIAEEKIQAGKVELYFCDAPKGVSIHTKLQVDEYGNILNWPDKFMGDAFSETVDAELARIKRMKAGQ